MMTDTTRPYQYCKTSETILAKTLLQLIGYARNAVNPCRELSIPAGSAIHLNRQIRPNQAMQLTANEPAVYAFRLAHHASMLRFMHKGLGAADLLCFSRSVCFACLRWQSGCLSSYAL